jgi:aryl-alcohol dehydrogenase-like predicted oxidoreductase
MHICRWSNGLTTVARARGVSNMQVALAWLLSKPVVTAPIVGATKMAHLEQAVSALEIELSAAEIAALEELYQPRPRGWTSPGTDSSRETGVGSEFAS